MNGQQISERTLLRNGYRLLFGVHHFFKVNCPKEATDGNAMEESCMYDYKDAWDEVNGEGAGGISAAVDQLMQRVSIKHEVGNTKSSFSRNDVTVVKISLK